MKRSILCMSMLLLAGAVAFAQQKADIPRVISYQGLLASAQGSPLADGEYRITVTLYGDEQGSSQIWQDTYAAMVQGGVFNIYLGSGRNPLPEPGRMNQALWIGTRVEGSDELRPLTRLSATPYAINVPDNSITTHKLADGAVTADKVDMDYISGVSVNGKKIEGKGTVLNIQGGNDISVDYDDATQSIVIGTPQSPVGAQGSGEKDGDRGLLGTNMDAWTLQGDGLVVPGALPIPAVPGDWIGTSGMVDFDIRVAGASIMRYRPVGPGTANVVGGNTVNNVVSPMAAGNVIAGGGVPGLPNTIMGAYYNVIGGGANNIVQNNASEYGTIGGGQGNMIATVVLGADFVTIGGGGGNQAEADFSTVSGGSGNQLRGRFGVIGGGQTNLSNGDFSAVGGGSMNQTGVTGTHAAIAGGQNNTVSGDAGTVGGGRGNNVAGNGGFIGGGRFNQVSGEASTIGGGLNNQISGPRSFIGGGEQNSITLNNSVIGGGFTNTSTSSYTFIGGGTGNGISGFESVIGGGNGNRVNATQSFIGGGGTNVINTGANNSVISGGQMNLIQMNSTFAAIGGGNGNQVLNNFGRGISVTIPGGEGLVGQSYGQTVLGVRNVPRGNLLPGALPTNDPILIVGNGTAGVPSTGFEVSYNGHSTVYHNNGMGAPVIRGSTYVDNVVYAWGDVGMGGVRNCDFGVQNIMVMAPGWYRVTLNITDPFGVVMNLSCASITATLSSNNPPGAMASPCRFIRTSRIGAGNTFDIYITENVIVGAMLQCQPVHDAFMFKVTGRP